MHIHNQSQQPNTVIWCTLSQCECYICQILLGYETFPILETPGWTFGSISVGPGDEFNYERCPNWDGTFIAMASSYFDASAIKYSMFMDLDETKNYTYRSIGLQICFDHDTCPVNKNKDKGFSPSISFTSTNEKWYSKAMKGAAKEAAKTVTEEVIKDVVINNICCIM